MVEAVPDQPVASSLRARLGELRRRADEDSMLTAANRPPGRHQLDLAELGLRVAMTRARYPNRPGGTEMYAMTVSRLAFDHGPAEPEVRAVLEAAFGESAALVVERSGGGPLVRMFRLESSLAHPR